MPDIDVFRYDFLPNIQAFNKLSYSSWKQQNPNEASRWEVYRDGLLANENPEVPSMSTKFGLALVAAGRMVQQDSPLPPNQARSQPTPVVA